jgi:hypothetical protein
MKTFLSKTPQRGREKWEASSQPNQAAKRMTQRGKKDDNMQWLTTVDTDERNEEPWQAKIMQMIMEAAGLTPDRQNLHTAYQGNLQGQSGRGGHEGCQENV